MEYDFFHVVDTAFHPIECVLTLISVTVACTCTDVEKDVSMQPLDSSSMVTVATDDDSVSSASVVHRKHKKMHRSSAATVAAPSSSSQDSSLGSSEAQVPLAPAAAANPFRKPANPYVAYRNIKLKVNERKKQLCTVVPKAQARFSKFRLLTQRYALHVGQSSLLPVQLAFTV